MASDPPESDQFRVKLNWPKQDEWSASRSEDPTSMGEEEIADTRAEVVEAKDDLGDNREVRDSRDEPTIAYDPEDEPDSGGSVLFTVASRLEGLRAALGNVGLRLDSLIRREEQFREFTTTRLAENAEQVAIAVGSTRSAIEDQAREQQNLNAAVEALRSDTVHAVDSLRDNSAEALDKLRTETVEAIDGQRRETTETVEGVRVQLTEAIAAINERLDAIAEAVVAVPQILEEVEVIRAELVASIVRTETRDEELAMEVGRMAEELRVLRRRVPVRTRRGAAEPADAPVDQDEDFTPTPPRGRIRRQRTE